MPSLVANLMGHCLRGDGIEVCHHHFGSLLGKK
jgi:hypothetical protein